MKAMNRLLTAIFAAALVLFLSSSTAAEEWDVLLGGTYGDSVQQTTDGGYIVGGSAYSSGEWRDDIWLIKTDADGTKQWERTFGGSGIENTEDVQQTSDGGYVILGYTRSFGAGFRDWYVVKTDGNGTKQWDRTFGGSESDEAYSIDQTTDGGYILVGGTESYSAGTWMIKIHADGSKEWDRLFSGHARSVQQTSDGGYVVAGSVSGDYWLVKTDADGAAQWERTFEGNDANGRSVQQTSDGGYIIAGYGRPKPGESRDFWLVKTDADGIMQWDQTFGGDETDYCTEARQASDGGYILIGYSKSFDALGGWDLLLVKADSNGMHEWERVFGEPGETNDEFSGGVDVTSDGGYIIVGNTSSYGAEGLDIWLIKVDDPNCRNYYSDADGDGYGDSSDFLCLEGPSEPYIVIVGGDCDDSDPAVNPDEIEVMCNGKDDDCDASTPDDVNADGDPVSLCQGDCDDNDPDIYPGAPEICGDGIDNDCDDLIDSDDPDCPGITDIRCVYPPNRATMFSSPTFSWTATGGLDNRFAVDLSYDWTFSWYWSTFKNMRRPIDAESWAMPPAMWNYIPSGRYVYWRVRGADLGATPLTIITGDDVWWFYKY